MQPDIKSEVDGEREVGELQPINCELDVLNKSDGSALLTQGEPSSVLILPAAFLNLFVF